jgi:hypothetical protein
MFEKACDLFSDTTFLSETSTLKPRLSINIYVAPESRFFRNLLNLIALLSKVSGLGPQGQVTDKNKWTQHLQIGL